MMTDDCIRKHVGNPQLQKFGSLLDCLAEFARRFEEADSKICDFDERLRIYCELRCIPFEPDKRDEIQKLYEDFTGECFKHALLCLKISRELRGSPVLAAGRDIFSGEFRYGCKSQFD